MQIVCYNCKNIWELSDKEIHSFRHRADHDTDTEMLTFICPNCGARNVVMEEDLKITDRTQSPVPVAGARSAEETEEKDASITQGTSTPIPTNPVEVPHSGLQKRGIVRVRSLEAYRDHNTWSEVMGEFKKGERVPVFDTWTDGKSTWLLLGPERWVNLEQNGEAAIDLLDD